PFEPGDEGAQELVQLIERVADRYSKLTEAIGDNIEMDFFVRASNCDYAMTMISPRVMNLLAKCRARFGYEFFQGQNERPSA
ncbi:MAG: hypothetical protein AAF574_10070, partial [Pseudomonadota bacterium]